MASFDDAIARMKTLYTYGKDLNENKTINSYTLEHKATGADGKTYGIARIVTPSTSRATFTC